MTLPRYFLGWRANRRRTNQGRYPGPVPGNGTSVDVRLNGPRIPRRLIERNVRRLSASRNALYIVSLTPHLCRKTLSNSLQSLHTAAAPPNVLPSVPPELLEYVENGRNPDIYTREFVELVRRGNQLMRGKSNSFGAFRDVLAKNMAKANPELRDDVIKVLEATGSSKAALEEKNGSASANNASEEQKPQSQDEAAQS